MYSLIECSVLLHILVQYQAIWSKISSFSAHSVSKTMKNFHTAYLVEPGPQKQNLNEQFLRSQKDKFTLFLLLPLVCVPSLGLHE